MSRLKSAILFALATVCVILAYGLYMVLRTDPQERMDPKAPLHADVVELRGNDNDADEPASNIVLLHPAYMDNSLWLDLLRYWPRDQPLRFIVPDILGHGRSPWPREASGYTMRAHITALRECIQRHADPRAPLHIVGMCIGGVFALELAALLRPQSLTLISSFFFRSEDEARSTGARYAKHYSQHWRLRLHHSLMRQRWLLRTFVERKVRKTIPKVTPELFVSGAMNCSSLAMHQTLIECAAKHRPQRAARRVGLLGIPTLVMRGEKDKLCPTDQQQEMCTLTNARSFVMRAKGCDRAPACGHGMVAHEPEAVLECVHSFIVEHDRENDVGDIEH